MKLRAAAVAAVLLTVAATVAYSGVAGFLTQKTQDWKFIQSVGGMKISLKGESLEIDCDVSGLKKVTVKPVTINSGMGVRKLKHKRVGKTIQLRLVTSVLEKGMKTSCKPVDLSAYPAGEYSVQYLDSNRTAHDLGKIVVGAGR